jgi:hypothetical protein
MTTTALYIELLLIGVQVLVWVNLAIALLFGVNQEHVRRLWSTTNNEGIIAVAIVSAVAYLLGAV